MIQRALNVSRVTIYHGLHKALEMGTEAGLHDAYDRPKEPAPIKPGWCIWRVRNPESLAMPQN